MAELPKTPAQMTPLEQIAYHLDATIELLEEEAGSLEARKTERDSWKMLEPTYLNEARKELGKLIYRAKKARGWRGKLLHLRYAPIVNAAYALQIATEQFELDRKLLEELRLDLYVEDFRDCLRLLTELNKHSLQLRLPP